MLHPTNRATTRDVNSDDYSVRVKIGPLYCKLQAVEKDTFM